ncbi:MAG TPA: hypothetical protein DCP31_34610 [Cyanobacteria bacterium UBA8543]|nr:hypothetical protein [Cyanobacteria bacterium UBA8543]
MTELFPPPPIKPLERIQVQDGLLMNADRWRRAHDYHHKRQSVHYQSLNQPGIVCGLGVRLITAPTEVQAQYRDERWLQVQPGIAIDLVGNPIVVPEPIDYRIASENQTQDSLIVYLVVSYVDPEKLRRKEQREIVQETFRLDEKISPPGELEVELCRILLSSDAVKLENTTDVFFPGFNNIDLRYRNQARSRPQSVVTMAQVNLSQQPDPQTFSNLSYLLQSVAVLYPAMEGADEVGQVDLQPGEKEEKTKLSDYDLLFLKYQHSQSPKARQWVILQEYLKSGGVLLVEASTEGTAIKELVALQQELKKAIADLEGMGNRTYLGYQNAAEETELSTIQQELETELAATNTEIAQEISNFSQIFQEFAQKLGTSLEPLEQLDRNFPLRIQPFLFAALPAINEQPLHIFMGGGIIVVLGNLSAAWGLSENLSLSRETIRTAQEMGINVLHFAWRRRQMMQLLQQNSKSVSESSRPVPKKQRTVKSILDELAE